MSENAALEKRIDELLEKMTLTIFSISLSRRFGFFFAMLSINSDLVTAYLFHEYKHNTTSFKLNS